MSIYAIFPKNIIPHLHVKWWTKLQHLFKQLEMNNVKWRNAILRIYIETVVLAFTYVLKLSITVPAKLWLLIPYDEIFSLPLLLYQNWSLNLQ